MKTPFLIIICFVVCFQQKVSSQNEDQVVKVLSYNIHYGIGMDSKKDLVRIAEIIKQSDADIIGLQEIADEDMAEELAELTDLSVVFGPSKETNAEYGDAILSKYPFKYVGNTSIPSASSSRYEAMCVDVDLSEIYGQNCTVRLINTHFDWLGTVASEVARKGAVEVIEEVFFIESLNSLALLTGDLNATPASEPLRLLKDNGWIFEAGDKEIFTEPSSKPNKQIDYVLARPSNRWRIIDVEVIDEPIASDHLPVLMTLEFIP